MQNTCRAPQTDLPVMFAPSCPFLHVPTVVATGTNTRAEACFTSMAVKGHFHFHPDFPGMSPKEGLSTHPVTRYKSGDLFESQFRIPVQYKPGLKLKHCFANNGSYGVGQLHSSLCCRVLIPGKAVYDPDCVSDFPRTDCKCAYPSFRRSCTWCNESLGFTVARCAC